MVEGGGGPPGRWPAWPTGAVPYTVGLTGAPGAGKSTLTAGLIAAALGGWPPVPSKGDTATGDTAEGDTAEGDTGKGDTGDGAATATQSRSTRSAVLAVDPSSPFTGGALLGDRVRMQDHATDPAVFVRSMATRGHLGGLALAVPEAVRVLGAAGLPAVIVETVGVGRWRWTWRGRGHDRRRVTPGWGDSIQATRPACWRWRTSSSSTRPTGPARAKPGGISTRCSTCR